MVEPRSRRIDFIPIIVLAAIVATMWLGIWLFPLVQKAIQREDCIALGRDDCVSFP